jgi:poly(beta-D-mannuronate) lyase
VLGRWGLAFSCACLPLGPALAEEYLVHDEAEYEGVAKQVRAGDVIVLANGQWRDFDLVITGMGSKDHPITLRAQEPGKVLVIGRSSLRIGGEYIVVSGLVFRDGYSPRGEVIAFRSSRDRPAFNSRVTEVVIDGFSKPGRYDDDNWVGLYGRNNRFDHNDLIGKTNKGVTLAVRLDWADGRDNGHQIDHNYFGPRQILGSNGGESIRIGTSTYSMHRSGTVVENNVFDRCDGEVEIISSKSGGNVYRGNLFLHSRGTLTLRHGDGNVVERNVFLGGGKDHTGGVRVINRDQIVRDNYMEGLRGTGFASALTVMNGVPNSPVNRYVQVQNALIEHNTIVDSAQVALGAGASAERTAPPVDSVMRGNLFSGIAGQDLFDIGADLSGIAFADNVVLPGFGKGLPGGFATRSVELVRTANGLLYPGAKSFSKVGAPRNLQVASLTEVGAPWYPKPRATGPFAGSGKVVDVSPGEDTLALAVAAASPGDVLTLRPGEYLVASEIPLDKPLTIRGAASDAAAQPVIALARPTLVELREGGNLRLEHVTIDGTQAPDSIGSSVVQTGPEPIRSNLVIELSGVTVRNLAVNASFNVVTLGKNAFADRVLIENSRFENVTGTIISAAAETEDYGQYNLEYLDIVGNTFDHVGGPIAAVYRGGTDESTFGPTVSIRDNELTQVGLKTTGGHSGAIDLLGVQTALIEHNTFDRSGAVRIVHTVGTPVTRLIGNTFLESRRPELQGRNFDGPPRVASKDNTIDGRPM